MSVVSIDQSGNPAVLKNQIIGKTIFDLIVERFNTSQSFLETQKSLARNRQTLQSRLSIRSGKRVVQQAIQRSQRSVNQLEIRLAEKEKELKEIDQKINDFNVQTDLQIKGIETLTDLIKRFNSPALQLPTQERLRRAAIRAGTIGREKTAITKEINRLRTELNEKRRLEILNPNSQNTEEKAEIIPQKQTGINPLILAGGALLFLT